MAEERGRMLIDTPAALAELKGAEDLKEHALRAKDEVRALLDPLRVQLTTLLVERDRLSYESLAAIQRFFQVTRKAHPSLEGHRGLRVKKDAGRVFVVWDDTGPRFSDEKGSEKPALRPFERRGPGQRAIDVLYSQR